ncbi:hypothetical protein, partial [Nodularia spumigena]|uniref:hypothetical protein n=1 Tax=Nodularia spumigena TaxID=70799 RepID=UPI002B202FE6
MLRYELVEAKSSKFWEIERSDAALTITYGKIGAKDPNGKLHGEVSWWRPDGTLCCTTDLVHGVPHGKFRRFHENGELSREGTFEQGKIVGVEAWQRSHKATTEYFGDYWATKKVWRMELDHSTGEKRFFD